MIVINAINICRDGGTVVFCVSGSDVDGYYSLSAPSLNDDKERLLYRDDHVLDLQGETVQKLIVVLTAWLEYSTSESLATALQQLDGLQNWFNLSQTLQAAIPLYRVRTVRDYLQVRCGTLL